MNANPGKCPWTTSRGDEMSMFGENYRIKSSKHEKSLGIKLGTNLILIIILMEYVKEQDAN